MGLCIEDAESEYLARRLAELTGETIEMATKRAIEERLGRVSRESGRAALLDDMAEIRRRWSELPVIDDRTPEDIVEYDRHGSPH